jgi:hypothetical protein
MGFWGRMVYYLWVPKLFDLLLLAWLMRSSLKLVYMTAINPFEVLLVKSKMELILILPAEEEPSKLPNDENRLLLLNEDALGY